MIIFIIILSNIQPDSFDQRIYNEIEAIITLTWQGKQLPDEEKKIVIFIFYIYIKLVWKVA